MKSFMGIPYCVDKVMDLRATYRLIFYPTRQRYVVIQWSKPWWWR